MIVESLVYDICQKNNFDYEKSLIVCRENIHAICKMKPDFIEMKKFIANIIKDKIPYSLYGRQPIIIPYEKIKEMVIDIENWPNDWNPNSNTHYCNVATMEYDEVKSDLESDLDILDYRIRKHHNKIKLKINYKGYPLSLGIKEIFLFKRGQCSCDICGQQVSHVSIDRHKTSDLYKLTTWIINQKSIAVPMTIEHKLAVGLGGRDTERNKTITCEECNSKKSSFESNLSQYNRYVEKMNNAEIYPFEANFDRGNYS